MNHMREMSIQAIYPHRSTNKPNPENKAHPDLLQASRRMPLTTIHIKLLANKLH